MTRKGPVPTSKSEKLHNYMVLFRVLRSHDSVLEKNNPRLNSTLVPHTMIKIRLKRLIASKNKARYYL